MAPSRAPVVLLVDDEPEILRALGTVLSRAIPGIEVRLAGTGAEALEALAREGADVIVSDFRMPGMDGVEFLGRSVRAAPRAKRVMLTAYPDALLAARALNEGHVSRFLVKPFSARDIAATVRELLEEESGRGAAARQIAKGLSGGA